MTVQALKEWAIVCRALEEGRQSILLRKGGILEYRNGFEVRHESFFLFPTFEHQERLHIQSDFLDRFDLIDAPLPNLNRINLFAKVIAVKEIHDRKLLKSLEPYHIWTESYVNARMDYNPSKPMSILLLRIFKLDEPITVQTRPEWAGCKSWIPLERDASGIPVLDDVKFADLSLKVNEVLSLAA